MTMTRHESPRACARQQTHWTGRAPLIGALIVVTSTLACGGQTAPAGGGPQAAAGSAPGGAQPTAQGPLTIDIVKVVEQPLDVQLSLPGELTAYQSVAIYPRVSGFVKTIRSIAVLRCAPARSSPRSKRRSSSRSGPKRSPSCSRPRPSSRARRRRPTPTGARSKS